MEEVAVDLGGDHSNPRGEGEECYSLWAETISADFNGRSQIGSEGRSLRDREAESNKYIRPHKHRCRCERNLERYDKTSGLLGVSSRMLM